MSNLIKYFNKKTKETDDKESEPSEKVERKEEPEEEKYENINGIKNGPERMSVSRTGRYKPQKSGRRSSLFDNLDLPAQFENIDNNGNNSYPKGGSRTESDGEDVANRENKNPVNNNLKQSEMLTNDISTTNPFESVCI